MNYFFNDRNLLRDAVVSALNVVSSSAIYRTDDDPKTGSGIVSLTGPYTGQHDSTFDIEILDGTGDSSQVSQPVFTGVGNGTMSDISATGLDAQQFTIQLSDLGIPTQRAYVAFEGSGLFAKTAGEDGNNIFVTIDHSALTYTATSFALQADIQSGTNEYIGDQWNFGAAQLNNDGTIPATAPRLRFGDDPQVYLAFKKYTDGRYVYSFSPAPVRDIPAGTKVYSVSGARTLTVTDATDPTHPEVFTGLVTRYDALLAIRNGSDLVNVGDQTGQQTPVSNDRHPGAMGAVELSIYTVPYVVGIAVDGSDSIEHADLDVTVSTSAPTESLHIKCISAATTGNEKWEVRGDASGKLDDAQTSVAYSDGAYSFTIPPPEVADGGTAPDATIVPSFEPLTRDESEQTPAFCPRAPRLGIAAKNGTFTFVYARKPAKDCTCDGLSLEGSPDPHCLGVTDNGGESVSDASRVIRLQRLTTAVKTMIGSNTSPQSSVAQYDIQRIETSAAIFHACLQKLSGGTLSLDEWVASHEYSADDMVEPTVRNGYRYAASFDTDDHGDSGSTEPTWPTTVGATIDDGDVTWTNIGKTPYALYDDYFDDWVTDMTALAGVGDVRIVVPWAANTYNTAFLNGDGNALWCRPTTRNGWLYRSGFYSNQARTGSAEPTWPTTQNNGVLDGGPTPPIEGAPINWIATVNYWKPSVSRTLGEIADPGTGFQWTVTTAGTSDSYEPDWSSDGPITDGTVVWTRSSSSATDLKSTDVANDAIYLDRYSSQMNDVLAAAGIDPNFESASTNGDGCWRDFDDSDYWWVDTDGYYLPIQTNHYYHSSIVTYDDDGKPIYQSTQEWGVGPGFNCVDKLKEGDRLVIRIDGVDGNGSGRGYQPGDTFTVSVIHAENLPMSGGQDGNDTQTWTVQGSEDGAFPPYYLIAVTPSARQNSHAYAVGDRYVPASANGHWYQVTVAGTSASSPPTFATDRTTFTDGTATVQDMGLLVGYSYGGIAFTITPGGIAFALSDTFTFSLIGGHFQWRQNGGSWSSSTVIGTTTLADGVSAIFTGGASSPSWATGDTFSFEALAINGADQATSPTDGRLTWTGSTIISITPTGSNPASRLALFDHTIPSDATIALQGSDDNFATTPTNISIPWAERNILAVFDPVTRAKWRITIDKGGSIFWAFLGAQMQPTNPRGIRDVGVFTKRRRVPGLGVRSALAGEIKHEVVSQTSFEDFMAGIDYACANDDRAFGVAVNEGLGEMMLVRFTGTEVEVTDLFDYQTLDAVKNRTQAFTLPVEALP